MPKGTLVAAATSLVLFWLTRDSELFHLLTLDQQHLAEPWRVVTAHWIHIDSRHLLWNLLALLALGSLIELQTDFSLLAAFGVGSIAVSLWFFVFSQPLWYAGLSGVLNTLFVLVLYTFWQQRSIFEASSRLSFILLALVSVGYLLKLAVELAVQTSIFGTAGDSGQGQWASAPGAHLAGALAGAVLCLVKSLKRR